MKTILLAFAAAAFITSCNDSDKNASDTSLSKTENVANKSSIKAEWKPIDSATAMRTMMEAGTPGEQHKLLAKSDGTWSAEATMWMAPGSEPIIGKSIATNKMLFGGRYQETTYKGDFMGMPYEGVSTTGYDNIKQVYFTTWMDNMSTMIMNMDGKYDEATKSLIFKGKMICPANGQECEMREVYRMVDDNNHVLEMYGPDMQTGKEFKSMEIKFTRKA